MESKEEKITEIKRKIDDGFYDDPNCLAELAEKLIIKMGLEQNE
jgi:anti-sigma28 factor (negative regulator of flagellin synthesis)